MPKAIIIHSIEQKIHLIRGQRVMLDRDLAELYGVLTKQLNRQIRRNIERFPEDFMIHLTTTEYEVLRCQIGTLKNTGRGQHRKYLPFAFTEHGILMLANVLRSQKACEMSVKIIQVFVRMRKMIATHEELASKLKELERKVGGHDEDIQSIIAAIQQLIAYEEKPKRRMGFNAD